MRCCAIDRDRSIRFGSVRSDRGSYHRHDVCRRRHASVVLPARPRDLFFLEPRCSSVARRASAGFLESRKCVIGVRCDFLHKNRSHAQKFTRRFLLVLPGEIETIEVMRITPRLELRERWESRGTLDLSFRSTQGARSPKRQPTTTSPTRTDRQCLQITTLKYCSPTHEARREEET